MKEFEMIIHAFFLEDGSCRLFVYRNRKITRGLPINFYEFKFSNVEEVVRNIDSRMSDNTWLSGIATASFDFHRNFYNNKFGWNQEEIKKEFEKIKVKEKAYFLNARKIARSSIKANCYFQRTVA